MVRLEEVYLFILVIKKWETKLVKQVLKRFHWLSLHIEYTVWHYSMKPVWNPFDIIPRQFLIGK